MEIPTNKTQKVAFWTGKTALRKETSSCNISMFGVNVSILPGVYKLWKRQDIEETSHAERQPTIGSIGFSMIHFFKLEIKQAQSTYSSPGNTQLKQTRWGCWGVFKVMFRCSFFPKTWFTFVFPIGKGILSNSNGPNKTNTGWQTRWVVDQIFFDTLWKYRQKTLGKMRSHFHKHIFQRGASTTT